MKVLFIIPIIIFLVSAYGWGNNIFRLVSKDDFAAPYKAEVLRSIGIFVPPLGIVLGYITFNEENI